ncbi:SCO family protein [uncultured Tateyamaria sp.]|uniref:SCO family protein n=1 Tax=uncultured Tateyamaria sp. TaxID=455651 RepID=UPI00260D1508|nr:SCO family protein [uncultured Tateyamaria sp.]
MIQFGPLMFALALATSAQAQVQGVMLDDPVPLPTFTFHDENGQTYASSDLTDQWTLVMIGFLTCPDVCPFTLGNLEAAVAETGMRVRPDNVPKVWFLSVDPDRDAEYISEYGPFFHPDFRSMTGTRENIDAFVEISDGYYRLMPPDADGAYDVQHTSAVSVIAPDGTLRAKLQPPFDPGLTAEFLARLQITYRKGLFQ